MCGVWQWVWGYACVVCGSGYGGMHVWCVAVGMGVCMCGVWQWVWGYACVVCGSGYGGMHVWCVAVGMLTLHIFLCARI